MVVVVLQSMCDKKTRWKRTSGKGERVNKMRAYVLWLDCEEN